jgi:hypothetical protein
MQLAVLILAGLAGAGLAAGGDPTVSKRTPKPERWTVEEQEDFLATADIVSVRQLGTGFTKSQKAVLSDGKRSHPAHIQAVDIYMPLFKGQDGSQEKDFKDSWKFNVAAYRLAKMLGLTHMVPVSVPRVVNGKTGSMDWWVDNVMFDEKTRRDRNVQAPDEGPWKKQLANVRVFDQLIHNMDRNQENLIITRDWKVWMIDHTRAFRKSTSLKNPKAITGCDGSLHKALKKLREEDVTRELGLYLTPEEIAGLMARRDKVLQQLDEIESAKVEIPARVQE